MHTHTKRKTVVVKMLPYDKNIMSLSSLMLQNFLLYQTKVRGKIICTSSHFSKCALIKNDFTDCVVQ